MTNTKEALEKLLWDYIEKHGNTLTEWKDKSRANEANYDEIKLIPAFVDAIADLILLERMDELQMVQRVGSDDPHGSSRYDTTEIYLRERIKALKSESNGGEDG
jgi:hypothetical protein